MFRRAIPATGRHSSAGMTSRHDQGLAEAVDLAQMSTDLAVCGLRTGRLDHFLEHVLALAFGGADERIERPAHLFLVAPGLEAREPLQLRLDLLARAGLERLALHLLFGGHEVLFDPDDSLLPSLDLPLEGQSRLAV